MILMKSMDFARFGLGIIAEVTLQAIRELNRPRKWTFRKRMEKSEKTYSAHLTADWSIHTSRNPSIEQDSKDHRFHWKSMISLKSMDFKIFNVAITTESLPHPIRQLNRRRKWTFRSCLEKSEKNIRPIWPLGGRSTLALTLVRSRIAKIVDFIENQGFPWNSWISRYSMRRSSLKHY